MVLLIASLFIGYGCVSDTEETPASTKQQSDQPTDIARVKVDRQGMIYLNGDRVSLEQLRQAFARLKEAGGAVWYYREHPEGEPPPEAMAVIEAITSEQLPVRLMEQDFE